MLGEHLATMLLRYCKDRRKNGSIYDCRNSAAAEKRQYTYFRAYTIIQTLQYAHCLILLQCVNTELRPVDTELMVG